MERADHGGRRALAGLGLAVAATAAYFYRAAFSGEIFIARDLERLHYPLKQFWAERVRAGAFPGWYPYDALGQPYAGVTFAGAFHPFNLLYLGLPLGWALKLNLLLCFPLALVGTYLLARRFGASGGAAALAATLYTFGGYLVGLTYNLPAVMAAASLPLALWGADRFLAAPSLPRAAGAAALLALLLLCGDVQTFVLALAVVPVLAVARHQPGRGGREAATVGGLWALGLLFAAVQVLPALAAPRSQAGRTAAVAMQASLHPLRLLEPWLGPLFGGEYSTPASIAIDEQLLKVGTSNLWAESLHLGGVGLVLALVALVALRREKRTWLLAGTAAVALWLMLGRYGGLYGALYAVLPPWRAFEFPERIAPFLLLPLALGAAAGLEVLQRDAAARRNAALAMGAFGLLCFGLLALERGAGWFSRGLVPGLWTGAEPSAAVIERLSSALQRGCGMTGAAALTAFILLAGVRRADVRGVLFPALCGVHLFVANEWLYDLTYPDLLQRPNAFAEAIHQREGARLGTSRVLAAVNVVDLPSLPGVTDVDSYAISTATALEPLTHALYGLEGSDTVLPAASPRVLALRVPRATYTARFAGLFGTHYLTLSASVLPKLGAARAGVIAENPALRLVLLRNPTALPRAYLARPLCVDGGRAAIARLLAPDFRPGRDAVVECASPLPEVDPDAPLGAVTTTRYEPDEVELAVDATHNAVLVLNDAYATGWRATLDGAPAPIRPANHAVRAVPVGPGKHVVRFTYRTPGLAPGAVLSAGSLSLVLAAALLLRARRRTSPPDGTTAPDMRPDAEPRAQGEP